MNRLRRGQLVLVFLIGILLSNQCVLAEVGDPQPVSDGIRTFRSHKNYVEAVDSASGKMLWRSVVYKRWKPIIRNPFIEEDIQWNIIVSLKLDNNILTVVNSAGSTYFLDVITGEQIRPPILKHNWLRNWWATIITVGVALFASLSTMWFIRGKQKKTTRN